MATITQQLMSQALSGEPGAAARRILTGRRKETERQLEKRAELLARPDLLEKHASAFAQTFTLSTRKLQTRKWSTKTKALEDQARGTSQEGFATDLLDAYTAALEEPKFLKLSNRQLLAEVAKEIMMAPDEEGKSRLERGWEHKYRADTSLGNLFGIFGEDRDVRKFPGYEQYLEQRREAPVDEWHTGPGEAAAIGAGFTTALMMGSRLLGRTAMFAPIPGARIVGGALMAIPEFMAFDAIHNVIAKTDWGRAREGTWRKLGADMLAGGVVLGGGYKAATIAIRKAAEKQILSKGVTEMLAKHPTAKRAIEAGEAQRVARVAEARANEAVIRNIGKEDVLDAVADLSGVLKNIGYEKKFMMEAARPVPPRMPGPGLVEPAVPGVRVAPPVKPVKPTARRPKIGAKVDANVQSILDVQGPTAVLSAKEARKVFARELTELRADMALRKSARTAELSEAITEQREIQRLAKRQAEKERIFLAKEEGKTIIETEKQAVTAAKEVAKKRGAQRTKLRKKKKVEEEVAAVLSPTMYIDKKGVGIGGAHHVDALTRVGEARGYGRRTGEISHFREGAEDILEGEGLIAITGRDADGTLRLVNESELPQKLALQAARKYAKTTGEKFRFLPKETSLRMMAKELPGPVMTKEEVKAKLLAARKGVKAKATFLGYQETLPGKPPLALYNIEGGKLHKSTVGRATLEREGIKVPETPAYTPEVRKVPPEATGLTEEARAAMEAVESETRKTVSIAEESGLEELLYGGGAEETFVEGIKKGGKDLTELMKDGEKLLGIGAIVGAGVAALGWPTEAEASPLAKVGIGAGKKVIRKILKPSTAKRAAPHLLNPMTGEPLTKFRIRPGGIHEWEISTSVSTKPAREVTRGKVARITPGKWKGGLEKRTITGHLIDGYNPAKGEWEWIDTADTAAEAVTALERWNTGLRDQIAKIVPAVIGTGIFGSIALADLFAPDTAEASVLSKAAVTVPRMVARTVKKAATKENMAKMAKEWKDINALHIPAAEGAKSKEYFQEAIRIAPLAIKEHGDLIKNIKATTTPMRLVKILSPYTSGEILYKTNPVPEIGNLQSVIGNNAGDSLKVVGNILRDVPEVASKKAVKDIVDTMAPIAKRFSTDVTAYRAVEMEISKTEKAFNKLYKALDNEKGEMHIPALEKIEAKRASLAVAKEELAPAFEAYTKEWEGAVKGLAEKYPATRIALAVEDTTGYTKYPWLRPMMKPEEEEAVIWLKNMYENYGVRMAEAGHDIIEGPYCHHAWHPDWLEKGAAKRLEEFGLDSKGVPFARFHHRAKYSKQMVPDINYIMQRYLMDAERRIQWSQFWGKGQKNSWYSHKRWIDTFGTPDQKEFWRRIADSSVPPAQTKANVLANIYSSFEVLRLLAFSPSVALKHYFKNVGTASTMGAGNFASHLPEAMITAVRGSRNSPEMKQIYRMLGIKSPQGEKKVFQEVADSFITQIHRMNMVADLDFEAMIPNKAGFAQAVTTKLQSFNRWGSIPVRAIESVDRHHTVVAAWEAAAKRGMTAQQAIYGIYSNILKLNFLSGAANPAWIRNPKIRAMLLFQNTVFKIMERRLMTAWRAGHDVKTAIGLIRHQDIQQTLKEMGEIGKYILGAEKEMKQNMIFDALTGSKDFFGTPAIKQAMTEAILSGAILMGGGAIGMNLMPQVWHVPLLRHGAKAPTLAINPFLNSAFRTVGEREKAEEYGVEKDFFMTQFLKNWLKSTGYLPQTVNKMVRMTKDEIPEVYKGSKWQYFFSVPAKGEHY